MTLRFAIVFARFLAFGRFAVFTVARSADLLAVDVLWPILRTVAAFALLFEASRVAPNPSDIPIKMPLASVAKFCDSRCAVLKLVSRCSRIAACARLA